MQPDQPLGVGAVLHPRRAEGRGHAALPDQGAHSAGWSGWSYPFSITIDADLGAGLSAPRLTARATTATEIMLSWTRQCNPNRENDCEPKGVDGYYLEYSEDGVYDREGIRLRSDQTSFVHWGLEPAATLYYRGGIRGGERPRFAGPPVAGTEHHHRRRRSCSGKNPWWGLTTRTTSNSIPMKERRRGRRKFRRFSRLAQPTRYSAFTLEGPGPRYIWQGPCYRSEPDFRSRLPKGTITPLAAANSKTIFVPMVDTFIVRPTMNRVAKFPSASRVSGPVVRGWAVLVILFRLASLCRVVACVVSVRFRGAVNGELPLFGRLLYPASRPLSPPEKQRPQRVAPTPGRPTNRAIRQIETTPTTTGPLQR